MAEDEERREASKRSGRRDPARNTRRDPPLIEGQAEDVTPPVAPLSASGDMMEAPSPDSDVHLVSEGSPAVEASTPEAATAEISPTIADNTVHTSEAAETPHGEPAASAAPTPAEAGHQRSIWGPLAALGFIVLAAGLLYLFHLLSALPPDNSAAVSDLRTRLAALESRPAAAADSAGLADRVAALGQAVENNQSGLAALGKRVDEGAGAISAQANLPKDIADLQAGTTGLKTDLEGVKASVAALPRPDIGRLEARIGDLDQRVSVLQGAVSSIPHLDLGPLTGKVDALESRLKPIEAEAEDAQSQGRVAQRRAAPVAVTAQAIIGAIDAGEAFPKELQALQALGVEPAKLAALQAVAANGAPSLPELQQGLADVRERIVTQGAKPVAGSYLDRLVAGASTLVQVRPLGSVVGDTPSAIVARMNDDLGADRLAAALAEWHKLPQSAQDASKALAERIKLRIDAEQAAKTIATDAIAAIAAARG